MALLILSSGLCFLLFIGLFLVLNPEMVSPELADRWLRSRNYKNF